MLLPLPNAASSNWEPAPEILEGFLGVLGSPAIHCCTQSLAVCSQILKSPQTLFSSVQARSNPVFHSYALLRVPAAVPLLTRSCKITNQDWLKILNCDFCHSGTAAGQAGNDYKMTQTH